MTCAQFPSTGLVPNQTTHTVGNVKYVWTGVVWESVTNGLTADQIDWDKSGGNPITQSRESLRRTYADAGYKLIDAPASFDEGGVLSNEKEVLLDIRTNKAYAWTGTFPKTVSGGTRPDAQWKDVSNSMYVPELDLGANAAFVGAILKAGGVEPDGSVDTAENSQVFEALDKTIGRNKVARDALRRTYAEAGLNMVDGSFEDGGTLTSANDVLLQERTGKAFSGPAGVVAAGTNPSSGGFVDYSEQIAGKRSFRSFGAIGDGVVDDYAALQAAIDWAGDHSGRCVYGHAGDKHKISSGLVLRFDNKSLNPDSRAILDFTGTELIPTTSGITALKVSRNYSTVINPTVKTYTADGMGVTAYALAPEDEEQTTQQVWQMYCTFINPVAYDCEVGFRFKPGPTVGGKNSGAFYHTIDQPRFQGVGVGFYFQRSISGDCISTRIFINNPIHVFGHCMFDMEAVDSLVVTGGSAEFINRTGKHAGNPTIKVHKPVSTDSISSSNCAFYSFFGEAGTTPYDFMATESIALVNCTFFAYANEGVNNTYALNNQLTNEGAVVSRSKYSNNTSPSLAVRREIGSNVGQAFLRYRDRSDFPAEFYADRGFTFASVIEKCPARDLSHTYNGDQMFGTAYCKWDAYMYLDHITLRQRSPITNGGWYFETAADVSTSSDDSATLGTTTRRWKQLYAVTGSINTSDAREKTTPNIISDDVLDAWGEVSHVTFKWLDAVAKKGDLARTHFGVIAQDVRDAFERHGLDGTQFGLLCYDAWDDEYEPIFEKREVTETVPDPDSLDGTRTITTTKEVPTGEVRLVRAAGDRWGIRPDQCLFLESAYQRRRCDRIEARLSAAGL